MRRFALAVPFLLLLGSPALAWTKAGHMVTGAIAYDVLKQDSTETLAAAVKLLKAHPQYARLWKKDVEKLPEADRDRFLFMMAGRWADDIRQNPDYDRPTWHYVNIPLKPAGQPDSVTVPDAPPPDNLLTAFEYNLNRLKTAPDPVEKAVALTWLFHLIGDCHQPLHCVTVYTTDYKEKDGDRGGNRQYIRVEEGSKPINLHYFWDGLITNSEDYDTVGKIAVELRLRKEFARDELKELAEPKFEAWARAESHVLGVKVAHRDGKLVGGPAEFSAPVLPEGYTKEAKAVGERRGVLAGYRIAEVLKGALK